MTPPSSTRSVLPIAEMAKRARGIVVGHATDAATPNASRRSASASAPVSPSSARASARRSQVGETRIGLGPELSCAVRVCVR